jgi:hypothetical protein
MGEGRGYMFLPNIVVIRLTTSKEKSANTVTTTTHIQRLSPKKFHKSFFEIF